MQREKGEVRGKVTRTVSVALFLLAGGPAPPPAGLAIIAPHREDVLLRYVSERVSIRGIYWVGQTNATRGLELDVSPKESQGDTQ
jgi:hypothetical protein